MNKKDISPNAKKIQKIVIRERTICHALRTSNATFSPTKVFKLKKSFLSGIASIMNVAGNHYRFDKYQSQNNDENALASDWNNVGDSLYKALLNFDK